MVDVSAWAGQSDAQHGGRPREWMTPDNSSWNLSDGASVVYLRLVGHLIGVNCLNFTPQ